jgi:hypothetical protein
MAETCCCTLLLYGKKKGHLHRWEMASELRGRYWDRKPWPPEAAPLPD